MQTPLWSLALSLALSATSAHAVESNSTRISKLEQKLAQLKAQQNEPSPLENIQISGFATVGFGKASNNLGYADYKGNKVHFSPDSIAALQLGFDINSKTKAVIQLVSRQTEDWDPAFEWAYISYEFDQGATARAGRLRAPVFMLSDYLEVGYAYPFARPSVEVYGSLPLTTIDGFDARIPFSWGDYTLTLQPFVGESSVADSSDQDSVIGTTGLQDIWGLATELSVDDYTFRVSYAETELDNPQTDFIDDQSGSFLGFGASWDNGDWQLMSEWTRIEVDGVFPDTDSYYASAAYRLDEFTPYVMISKMETQDDHLRANPLLQQAGLRSSSDAQRTSYSMGVRWDFAPSVGVKFDVTHVSGLGSTSGGFDSNSEVIQVQTPNGQQPVGVVDSADQIKDSTLVSVLFDVVF